MILNNNAKNCISNITNITIYYINLIYIKFLFKRQTKEKFKFYLFMNIKSKTFLYLVILK